MCFHMFREAGRNIQRDGTAMQENKQVKIVA